MSSPNLMSLSSYSCSVGGSWSFGHEGVRFLMVLYNQFLIARSMVESPIAKRSPGILLASLK